MKIWKVEFGHFDESNTVLALSRHLALRAAVNQITAKEFSQFVQSLGSKSERDEGDRIWHHKDENPEAVLAFWFGESNAQHPDDHENETWGDGDNYAHVILLDVIESEDDL